MSDHVDKRARLVLVLGTDSNRASGATRRDANPEPDLAGYELATRETSAPDWAGAIAVGNVTSVTLDIVKDDLQFGVRAVDHDGCRGPVGFTPCLGRPSRAVAALSRRSAGACGPTRLQAG